MRNFSLSIILLIIIPTFYFSSCSKTEDYSDDKEKPSISNVTFNVKDTFFFDDDMKVTINDSNKILQGQIPILPIGKAIILSAEFRDNRALSTFLVRIDTIKGQGIIRGDETKKDSINFSLIKLGAKIFDSTYIKVSRNSLDYIPEYTVITGDTFYTKEGIRDVSIICMDKAGNTDTLNTKVRLMTRKSIYEKRDEIAIR